MSASPHLTWHPPEPADMELVDHLFEQATAEAGVMQAVNWRREAEIHALKMKGALAGAAAVEPATSTGGKISVVFWYLAPGWRGLGLGCWMLEQILALARSRHAESISITLPSTAAKAAAILKQSGFVPPREDFESDPSGRWIKKMASSSASAQE